MGTPSTIKSRLYKFKNLQCLKVTKEEIEALSQAIYNFNKGESRKKQIKIVKEIIKRQLKNGAEIVILGCTELAVMAKGCRKTLDPMDILIQKVIETIYGK